jgi:hypothetical protein
MRRLPRSTSGKNRRCGQATVEYALIYGAIIMPLTFMIIFVAEMFWVWHSVADYTRESARYAATHCWMGDGSNVQAYMQSHVPPMVDMDQFTSGGAGLTVTYQAIDVDSGSLTEFSCDGECTTNCIPDVVTVSISNYQFTRFSGFFKLPAVTMPDFRTTVPMESAGCDEGGNCLP